jgi:type I restriction enzyme S subunit
LKRLASFIGRGRGPTYVESGGVPVVNQKCIRWHRLETQHLKQTAREAFERLTPELRLKRGDMLWNSTGTGTIGRALIYDGSIPALTFDSHVTLVRPASILPAYLGYLVETTRVQSLVTDGHVGSTNQQELPRSFVEDLLVPLPPLPEQCRIAAKVDQLFAEIAEGEAALAAARNGLDSFRRALLKAAVTGELTKDWRAANPVSETGHDLLARITKDRSARGRARRSSNAASSDLPEPPELPEGWAWTTLEILGDPTRSAAYGVLQPGPDCTDGIPMVRVQDINSGAVALGRIKRISQAVESGYKRTRLQGGEVLITLVGSIGRTAVAPPELKGANTARAVGVVPLSPMIDPRWVEIWLRSPAKQNELVSQAHEVARKTLNLEEVRRATVAIPPPAESAEILCRVSAALAAHADTLTMLDAEAADAARLKQSILKAAFEGHLVPQDPADEPASALLLRSAADPSAPRAKRGRAKSKHGKAGP